MRFIKLLDGESVIHCTCGAVLYYTQNDMYNFKLVKVERDIMGSIRVDKEQVAHVLCPNCGKEVRILLGFKKGH